MNFDVCTFDDAVADLLATATAEAAVGGTRLSNAWCVVIAEKNKDYAALLNSPGRTLPDGAPVAALIRRRDTTSTAERVRGPSFFEAALDRSQATEIRHFFIGATPETLASLLKQVGQRYPQAHISGSWAPPFGPVDDALLNEAIRRVRASGANLVWVGMGSPKQDFVANAIARETGVPAVGVGAAFDFAAGTVAQAPVWVQRYGLEWLFRLAREPRRLGRRYLLGNLQFLLIVAYR
ncbi:WecB/TagA/CpsF family glycosyltransferase [Microbacterium sp. SCN 69-37]|uniref:WecB/TagA/CpsF family glycosyltransferase n=1 Tax=Microbacterium sp. SCN 69-37 TaxID=1660115 RepID=UPI0025E6E5E0|nr:WecB/TagA/CpsF family glycosyltransferase [Microbacterium sp. SCN 69-37]